MPATSTRACRLAERYAAVRAHTDRLAGPLSAEDQQVQSMPDVSPTKWHRAHTTWFFETFLLSPSLEGYRVFDDDFGYLFNSYYETVGARHPRPDRGLVTRPSADRIGTYRAAVDEAMAELLGGLDDERDAAVLDLVELGIHHEQQHQELVLMDIKHVLSVNPTRPAYHCRQADPAVASPWSWIHHEAATATIGHAGDGFAFDNESPRHDVLLAPFAIADRLVTNGEWLAFMDDGGYDRPTLWLSDGWATVQSEGWRAPLYWFPVEGGWQIFSLDGARPVDMNEPVSHVSHYEADAFARWAGARLPLESEWEHAVDDQAPVGNFVETGVLHPVGAPPVEPSGGLRQAFGDLWEWTSSPYVGYPGFRTAPGAVGEYNGKFMMNQMVLRGGCCATPQDHIRTTYRNFFPPHARWMFSGVRLAKDLT